MARRVLLSSVFKPFGVDSIYSRRDSKIELYHNQLTKYQGAFSMRTFMNSYGLHAIANNVDTPADVLEFPSLSRFRRELKKGYDIVGIGSILPNLQKVKRMVEEVREVSPRSIVVVGGFCANLPDLEKLMEVDHLCVGEGISFMRDLLGEPPEFRFKNPDVFAESREVLGVPVIGVHNPHIIVGLGCSYGCDFCSPSHFFGRRHIKFYETGKDLFQEMVRVEERFNSNLICFIGDDNFLLDLNRAEELRQCVVESGRVFNLMIFGSADKAVEFGPRKLAEMGVGQLWIGRESSLSSYRKNRGIDMKSLVAELRSYGIKTILSSILLLDEHTRENIREDISEHIACRPAFSQFAHYSPVPGTPLYDRLSEAGKILTAIPFEEWHAFKQPWFVHPEFTLREAEDIQEEAYLRDFHELGPSLVRYIEAEYEGWKNLKDALEPHLRSRAEFFAGQMRKYKAMLRASELLAPNQKVREMSRELRERIESDFGRTDVLESFLGRGLWLSGRVREARTRVFGDALQPPTRLFRYDH